jgi:phospholipid/cholesterol/gamma-HCH transport system ATP-binding protein
MPEVVSDKKSLEPRQGENTPAEFKDDEVMVELKDVHLSFGHKKILKGVSFQVRRNEILTVVGPSGTGKSTTVKIITGLLTPDSGEVIVKSDKIGLAFQGGALFTSLSVGDNLGFILERTTDLEDEEIERKIQESLALVGLENEINKMPDELSGGMQKRVGIARALAIDPDIMLYDEPSAGLDPILANKLEKDLRRVNEERKVATLLVTHELPSIENMADRIVMLYEGEIVYEGTRDDFFSTREPYAYQFRTRREAGPMDV